MFQLYSQIGIATCSRGLVIMLVDRRPEPSKASGLGSPPASSLGGQCTEPRRHGVEVSAPVLWAVGGRGVNMWLLACAASGCCKWVLRVGAARASARTTASSYTENRERGLSTKL